MRIGSIGGVLVGAAMLCALATTAAAQAPETHTVVTVGDEVVTDVELRDEFLHLPPPQLDRLRRDDNAARIFAVKWYSNVLFAKDAETNGLYERNPGVKAAAQALSRDVIARAYLEDVMATDFAADEEELRQLYAMEGDKLCRAKPQYRVGRAGVVSGKHATEEEKKAAKARMDEILKRLDAGESFSKVADELSDFGGTGGDMGWLTDEDLGKTEGPGDIRGLEDGKPSEVKTVAQGQLVYAILERSGNDKIPFEKCRGVLEQSLQSQFSKDINLDRIDELAKKYGASMNMDYFIAAVRAVPLDPNWEATWRPDGR